MDCVLVARGKGRRPCPSPAAVPLWQPPARHGNYISQHAPPAGLGTRGPRGPVSLTASPRAAAQALCTRCPARRSPLGPAARGGWSRAAAVGGPPRPRASAYRGVRAGAGDAPRDRGAGPPLLSAPRPAGRLPDNGAPLGGGQGGGRVAARLGAGRGRTTVPPRPGSPGVLVTQRGPGFPARAFSVSGAGVSPPVALRNQ